MAGLEDLNTDRLPKQSWTAWQRLKLDQPGANDRFAGLSSPFTHHMRTTSPQDRNKCFQHLSEAVYSVCDLFEFNERITVFRDLKMSDGGEGVSPRHRTITVGYNTAALVQGRGAIFPADSSLPNLEEMRQRRLSSVSRASFLLVSDGESRLFRSQGDPALLQFSLDTLGADNLGMLDPMKAFQTSGHNHVGCTLGILSHLTFIYQCEIQEGAKVLLSVIWVKMVQEKHSDLKISGEPRIERGYCKTPVQTFDVRDSSQSACLFSWIYHINKWALEERLDAIRMAHHLDELRTQRFRQASVAMLQEFGVDLSTRWLSEQVRNPPPGRSRAQRSRSLPGSSAPEPSPSTGRQRSRKRSVEGRKEGPPPVRTGRQNLMPAPQLESVQRRGRTGDRDRHDTASTETSRTKNSSSSGRSISAEKHIASAGNMKADLASRLMLMSAIYESLVTSPNKSHFTSDILMPPLPIGDRDDLRTFDVVIDRKRREDKKNSTSH